MSGTQKTTEKYAIVVVPIPNDEGFTYGIPEKFAHVLQPGSQVVVPFGRRFLTGIVLSLSNTIPANLSEDSIKMIRDVVYPQPLVSSEMRDLLRWISDY
ncbi:MAG: primosomal protein N', partial [Calditrichota bacterium]